jgi:hypothetical protein
MPGETRCVACGPSAQTVAVKSEVEARCARHPKTQDSQPTLNGRHTSQSNTSNASRASLRIVLDEARVSPRHPLNKPPESIDLQPRQSRVSECTHMTKVPSAAL